MTTRQRPGKLTWPNNIVKTMVMLCCMVGKHSPIFFWPLYGGNPHRDQHNKALLLLLYSNTTVLFSRVKSEMFSWWRNTLTPAVKTQRRSTPNLACWTRYSAPSCCAVCGTWEGLGIQKPKNVCVHVKYNFRCCYCSVGPGKHWTLIWYTETDHCCSHCWWAEW